MSMSNGAANAETPTSYIVEFAHIALNPPPALNLCIPDSVLDQRGESLEEFLADRVDFELIERGYDVRELQVQLSADRSEGLVSGLEPVEADRVEVARFAVTEMAVPALPL